MGRLDSKVSTYPIKCMGRLDIKVSTYPIKMSQQFYKIDTRLQAYWHGVTWILPSVVRINFINIVAEFYMHAMYRFCLTGIDDWSLNSRVLFDDTRYCYTKSRVYLTSRGQRTQLKCMSRLDSKVSTYSIKCMGRLDIKVSTYSIKCMGRIDIKVSTYSN